MSLQCSGESDKHISVPCVCVLCVCVVNMCLFVFVHARGGMGTHVPPPLCGVQRIPLGVDPHLSFLTDLMSKFQGLFTAG